MEARLPDPLPLREVLRGLRHVMRRGGMVLAQTVDPDILPGPVAPAAARLLREAHDLARGLDSSLSGVAGALLRGGPVQRVSLSGVAGDASDRFARCFHMALVEVLAKLGVALAFDSEIAVRTAHQQTAGRFGATEAETAAALMLALLELRVLRDVQAGDALVSEPELETVAVFAVLLWLLSDWPEDEADAALTSAVALAVGLASEVASAARAMNPAGLAEKFERYARHV